MISNALILLGDAPISSLNDPGAGALVAANLYDSSYRSMLSIHRWRFATKTFQLSKLTASPSNTDWNYQYQLPSDYLYLIKTDAGRGYEIYEDKVLSNATSLTIDYVYEVNEDFIPPYFAKAFEFFLASEFAIPVTGNSQRAEYYRGQYEAQLKRAKFLDSSQRPSDVIQHQPFIEVRY